MSLWFYHVGGRYSHVQYVKLNVLVAYSMSDQWTVPRRNANNIPMSSSELADKLLGPKVNMKIKDGDALQFFLGQLGARAFALFDLASHYATKIPGITPCGASYLLLSAQALRNPHIRSIFGGQAWSSQRFISLSPIQFADAGTLSAKLATLANNKARKQRQDYRDRSQANVAFTTGSDVDTLQQAGVERANFEHNRFICYGICQSHMLMLILPGCYINCAEAPSIRTNMTRRGLRGSMILTQCGHSLTIPGPATIAHWPNVSGIQRS
jgi:hypothetical protein